MEQLLKSICEFREAFVIAVGDKSPFAKVALSKLDGTVGKAISQQLVKAEIPVIG